MKPKNVTNRNTDVVVVVVTLFVRLSHHVRASGVPGEPPKPPKFPQRAQLQRTSAKFAGWMVEL